MGHRDADCAAIHVKRGCFVSMLFRVHIIYVAQTIQEILLQ